MNTKQVAEYLGINEKQVYALIKSGSIPCTRATGKWLFRKNLIDTWLEQESINNRKMKRNPRGTACSLLAAGSNDPIMEILYNRIISEQDCVIFSSNTGSLEGLKLLNDGLCDMALCHLGDRTQDEPLEEYLKKLLPGSKAVMVHLFQREIGFITSPQKKYAVTTMQDVIDQNLEFINRQEGSGTRLYIETLLENTMTDASNINGFENDVKTHFEVALAVKNGNADVGIGSVSAAMIFDLPFYPLKQESFDMVLLQETFFRPEIQDFIETLSSDEFRTMVKPLGNYDFTSSGKILFSL